MSHNFSPIFISFLFFLSSCASTDAIKVKLSTSPIGAEVFSSDGKLLGTTPLNLNESSLREFSRGGKLFVELRRSGYSPKQLILEIHGTDSHLVRMEKLDDKYFSRELTKDFSHDANRMVRELLRIHGLIIAENFEEAHEALLSFKSEFPNIAAAYTLLADLALIKGDREKARAYLLRGETLDDQDPVIQKRLDALRSEAYRK